jgi:hypothetical protein
MAFTTVTYSTAGTYNIVLPTNVKSLTYEMRGASGGKTGPGGNANPTFTPGAEINGGPGEKITGELSAVACSGKTLVVQIGTKGFAGTTNNGADGNASGGTGPFSGGAGGSQPGGEILCNSGGGAGGGAATSVSVDNGFILIAGGGGGAGGATYDQWDSQYRTPNGSAISAGIVGTTLNASAGQAGGNGNTLANAGSGGGGGGNNGNFFNGGGAGGLAQGSGNHVGGNHGFKGGSYKDVNFVTEASTSINAFTDNDGFFELTYETGDPPNIQFNVSPAAVIVNGTGATLSWECTGDASSAPTNVTLNGQNVAFVDTLPVNPNSTTTYTIVATGPGGITSDSIVLTVIPAADSLNNEFVTTYGTGSHTLQVPAGTTNAFVTIAAGRGGSGGSDAGGSGCPGGSGRVGQFRLKDNGAGNPYGSAGSLNQTIYQNTTVAVPADITEVNYVIQGGKGGSTATFTTGKLGQKISGVLTNIAGQTLNIVVGGNGGAGNSSVDLGSPGQGYDDGGEGGDNSTVSSTYVTVPLYRYFNATTGDHFTGLDVAPPAGYVNEGQIANVFTDPKPPGTITLQDVEPGKPASTYTAYVFSPTGTAPFFIDVTEIPTTLLYAKTNGTDVLWTSNVAEGNGDTPAYNLDVTDNAFGYAFYAPTSPVSLTVDGATSVRGGGGGGSSAIHIGNTSLVVAGGGGGAGGPDACGTLDQTAGQGNGILYTTGARATGLDGGNATPDGGGGGGGGAGGGWTPSNLAGAGGAPCVGGTGGQTGNGYYNLSYSQNAGVLTQGDNFNSGDGYITLSGAGSNNWNLIIRVGDQGNNGASGSPGGKPGGSGGTGAAGFMDGGGGGSDSLGSGWSGSGAGGGAGSGVYDTDNNRWFASAGAGGGGGGGSLNAGCSGTASSGGSWSATTNVSAADGGIGSSQGGDGAGGGGGGGGHSGGSGGGSGSDNSSGGGSGGSGTSRYDNNALELLQGNSTNSASGYAIVSFSVPPQIAYFRADDNNTATDVYEGDVVTLSWSTLFNGVESASFAEIDNGVGTVSIGEQSTTVIAPSTTTTYTLTVSNAGVFSQQAVTLNVLAPDNIPDLFAFDSIFDADLNTQYISNEVTITGIQVDVTGSASNGAFLSVNGAAYTQSAVTISNGDTVTLRLISPDTYTSTLTSTITIGLTSSQWNITTIQEPGQFPNAFEFENVLGAPTNSYVQSNEITITGITVPVIVTAPTNGFESSVNGSSFSTAQKVINNGEVLILRYLTSGNLGELASTFVTVGDSPNKNWSITNVTTADQDPNYFDFVNVVGAAANTLIESLPQVISGINVPTPIILTGGAQFRVGTGAWASSGNINLNDAVQLRVTSSADYGGEVEIEVTIGSLTDIWKVITTSDGDQIPNAFFFINQINQVPNSFVYSNTVLVQGLTAAANITVTGGNFKVGNGGWVTSGQINNGETLRLRILTPNSLSQTGNMSITVGP